MPGIGAKRLAAPAATHQEVNLQTAPGGQLSRGPSVIAEGVRFQRGQTPIPPDVWGEEAIGVHSLVASGTGRQTPGVQQGMLWARGGSPLPLRVLIRKEPDLRLRAASLRPHLRLGRWGSRPLRRHVDDEGPAYRRARSVSSTRPSRKGGSFCERVIYPPPSRKWIRPRMLVG